MFHKIFFILLKNQCSKTGDSKTVSRVAVYVGTFISLILARKSKFAIALVTCKYAVLSKGW